MIQQTLTSEEFAIASTGASSRATATLDDLEDVIAAYRPLVFRFLLVSLRDSDAAESLTQDTFLRAYNQRDRFRGECSLRTWLMRIAVNLLRDHTRTERFKFWKRAALDAVQPDDISAHLSLPGSSAESLLIAREQVAQVWSTVARLSSRQRSVFLLRFVEELELPEIATATGMPVSTVKSHLYRALAVVRAEMGRASQAAPVKVRAGQRSQSTEKTPSGQKESK